MGETLGGFGWGTDPVWQGVVRDRGVVRDLEGRLMGTEDLREAMRQWGSHWRRSGLRWLPKLDPPSIPDSLRPGKSDGSVESHEAASAGIPSPMVPMEQDTATPAGNRTSATVAVGGRELKGSWGDLPVLSAEELRGEWGKLESEVSACQRCPALAKTRQRTVFGEGSRSPRVVLFGEAPGADEDRTGRPFVGAAGQLLDKIIMASKLRREELFIMNTLKCRPPGNRTPEESEIASCRGYFERQLELLRPEFVVCLGAVAAKSLLQTQASIGQLRGKFHAYRGAQVIVTYHPAYLLRNPEMKKHTWTDMQMLMKALGIPVA